VKAGNLSANAAMIQAGFRKKRTPAEWLAYYWDRCSREERDRFMTEKNESGW
jgi:hypothetical protein